MSKKRYFMLHSAVTIIAPEYVLGMKKTGEPIVHKDGKDEEVAQFAAEFHKWPVPQTHFKKAWDEMYTANLDRAIKAGLVLP